MTMPLSGLEPATSDKKSSTIHYDNVLYYYITIHYDNVLYYYITIDYDNVFIHFFIIDHDNVLEFLGSPAPMYFIISLYTMITYLSFWVALLRCRCSEFFRSS